jgi:hypothetical protein
MAQHCADLGVPIEWEDLGPKRRGKCQALAGRIILNPRMTLVQAGSTLAHEIGHWVFGDLMSTAANERRAWEYGASLMVTRFEYEMAERVVGHHPAALAIELGVTVKIVEGWRRWWLRRGQFEDPSDWTDESLATP